MSEWRIVGCPVASVRGSRRRCRLTIVHVDIKTIGSVVLIGNVKVEVVFGNGLELWTLGQRTSQHEDAVNEDVSFDIYIGPVTRC